MKEEWRDIVGYEGLYQVSNLGRVMSLGNGICNSIRKILKLDKQRQGYMLACLYKNGVKKSILFIVLNMKHSMEEYHKVCR